MPAGLGAVMLCLVVGIADGDTMTLRCEEKTVKVRLAEIDAPEKRQPWGTRSRQALADLCFQHEATLRPEKLDRYGRTVGRVECAGRDASLARLKPAWPGPTGVTSPMPKSQTRKRPQKLRTEGSGRTQRPSHPGNGDIGERCSPPGLAHSQWYPATA